jgi:hypothetical protein
MADPNLDLLLAMARALGPLRDRLVFVGGCATGLLVTNPAAADVRATEDVDAIVEVRTLAGYHALGPLLAQRGFKQTMEDNTPPFRWYWQRLQLDLVPVNEAVLGFANRWYTPGFAAAVQRELAPRITLRHLTAPYFLATKFEAFNDRGAGDVYLSHDLEDILTVVDGRAELVAELNDGDAAVRTHVLTQTRKLLNHENLLNALPGLISQPARLGIVVERLQQIASLNKR